jgi:hypothetical protein
MKHLTRLGGFIATLTKVASWCLAVLSSVRSAMLTEIGGFNWRVVGKPYLTGSWKSCR